MRVRVPPSACRGSLKRGPSRETLYSTNTSSLELSCKRQARCGPPKQDIQLKEYWYHGGIMRSPATYCVKYRSCIFQTRGGQGLSRNRTIRVSARTHLPSRSSGSYKRQAALLAVVFRDLNLISRPSASPQPLFEAAKDVVRCQLEIEVSPVSIRNFQSSYLRTGKVPIHTFGVLISCSRIVWRKNVKTAFSASRGRLRFVKLLI